MVEWSEGELSPYVGQPSSFAWFNRLGEPLRGEAILRRGFLLTCGKRIVTSYSSSMTGKSR